MQRLPEDETMAERFEDSSSLLVQKRFRGNVGRTYAAWYKGNIQQVRCLFLWDYNGDDVNYTGFVMYAAFCNRQICR